MTASLFLDPAANYIKVNYFPVHPSEHPSVKSGMDQFSLPLETNGFWQKRLSDYEKECDAARASAVKVKDQEVGDGLIHFHHAKSMDFMVEPNVLYPIPGLTFKVDEIETVEDGGGCFVAGVESVAILELPSYNNTPDNSREVENVGIKVPIEQQESQENLMYEFITRYQHKITGEGLTHYCAIQNLMKKFTITRTKK